MSKQTKEDWPLFVRNGKNIHDLKNQGHTHIHPSINEAKRTSRKLQKKHSGLGCGVLENRA